MLADERLDRLLGDVDLLLRLQLSGYAPDNWEPVAAELARYGLDVIRGWLRRGVMLIKAHQKTGYPLSPPDKPFDDDAVETLATDTVIAALDAFLNSVLLKNKWDPARGASLKTFFIGQCCFQFANAYKKWHRTEGHQFRVAAADNLLHTQRWSADAPAADAGMISDDDITEALGLLSTDLAREVVALQAVGYSHQEISEMVGLQDDKAVENVLSYQRRQLERTRQTRHVG